MRGQPRAEHGEYEPHTSLAETEVSHSIQRAVGRWPTGFSYLKPSHAIRLDLLRYPTQPSQPFRGHRSVAMIARVDRGFRTRKRSKRITFRSIRKSTAPELRLFLF